MSSGRALLRREVPIMANYFGDAVVWWGLGLIDDVNGHRFLLHDGRARTIEEAILWHGGEAANARQRFFVMNEADRAVLLEFLKSL